MSKSPRILLVMHDVPLNSGFLAAKFIRLSERLDTHLLVWDSQKNIGKFIDRYNIKTFANKVHSGVTNTADAFSKTFTLLYAVLFVKQVRAYIFSGQGNFSRRLKLIMQYLPVFTIKPDIIHFEFGTLAKDIRLLKHLTNATTVVSFRGYDINYVGLDNPNYYDELWQHIDAIHFLGEDLKRRALSRGYKGNRQEAIIAPAIDITHFTPDRKENGNTHKLTIISVGRLVWKKGYDLAIRTMALLKQRDVPFEYHIIGGGEQLQALQFIKNELDLDGEVQILGDKNAGEVKQALNNADIFLHPAISEGFCNAVLEAQAMGLPVVCSDADGLAENVVDGVTGFVIPKWNVEAMAEKLEWFWNNKSSIEEMGNAGMQRVCEHFRIEEQIDKFERFYKDLHAKQ
jgi:colanic acid/amylovoran biosynthesis glycosyltransferase